MNSTQSYHPPPFGPPHRHSHPHTLSRSRSAIDASQQKTRIDRYVPRVMSSSYLSAPLAEAASPSPAPRAHHGRHRQHSHQRSRKSPTVDRSKDVPKSHPRIKRKTDSFYASRRRSAAALARSLKEQQTADPESRLDLGRDMLWALMAEAGLSPLASGLSQGRISSPGRPDWVVWIG
ncbi:hypothetical protein BC829DRAFT_286800 [Chytridium lagenaria]|nr:hypothetical protein BC829DRAFT_286800 [Chytridium lagenaria]